MRQAAENVTIVIPLFNQLQYTKICLESLQSHGVCGARILLINNGSTDGTREYLTSCQGVDVLNNLENLGCAGAWNQGVEESATEWVLLLNNDVIVSPGWLEGLLSFARERGVDVVTPAIREGSTTTISSSTAGASSPRWARSPGWGLPTAFAFW